MSGPPRVNETQDSVTDWATQTFGPVQSAARAAARINEEMAELLKSVVGNDQKAPEEMADVLICLYRLASHYGVDLHKEVFLKMAINRKRKWVRTGDGCGYHVKEE